MASVVQKAEVMLTVINSFFETGSGQQLMLGYEIDLLEVLWHIADGFLFFVFFYS